MKTKKTIHCSVPIQCARWRIMTVRSSLIQTSRRLSSHQRCLNSCPRRYLWHGPWRTILPPMLSVVTPRMRYCLVVTNFWDRHPLSGMLTWLLERQQRMHIVQHRRPPIRHDRSRVASLLAREKTAMLLWNLWRPRPTQVHQEVPLSTSIPCPRKLELVSSKHFMATIMTYSKT